MSAAPKIGRAEALRRSMLALIDKGPERFAHPAAWAPFVVVGEGGAGSDWKYGGHERKYQTGSSEIILGAGAASVALPEAQVDPRSGEIGVIMKSQILMRAKCP